MRDVAKELKGLLGAYALKIDRCIRCGFCNSVCPTSNIRLAYMGSKTARGRLVMLQAITWGSAKYSPFSKGFLDLIELCFGCRRCLAMCPAGIPIPQVMWHVRYAASRGGSRNSPWLLRGLMKNYDRAAGLASFFPHLINRMTGLMASKLLMEKLLGFDRRVSLPTFNPLKGWKPRRDRERYDGKLVYFGDIFGLYHEGGMVKRLFDLLDRLGYFVEVPKQKQAGIPLLELGMVKEARETARENVRVLRKYAKKGYGILTTSPAAYLALKQDYVLLLGGEAKEVADKTMDSTQLLNWLLEEERLSVASAGCQVTYHSGCFPQASTLSEEAIKLLKNAGFKITRITTNCCGVGGIWGMMRKHYETAIEVGERLFKELEGAKTIVSQSETCRLWMRNFLKGGIYHPVELVLKYIR